MLCALALALTVAPAAAARTQVALPDGSTPAPEARWIHNSLVPTPDSTVTLVANAPANPEFDAEAWIDGLAPGDQPCDAINPTIYLTPSANRFSFYHELGHLFDCLYLTGVDHVRFRAFMHDHFAGWWEPYPNAFSYDAPAEHFAQAYALCSIRRRLVPDSLDNHFHWFGEGSPYDYHPTPPQHRKVCKLIRSAYAAH